jgi:hypothetical protein
MTRFIGEENLGATSVGASCQFQYITFTLPLQTLPILYPRFALEPKSFTKAWPY